MSIRNLQVIPILLSAALATLLSCTGCAGTVNTERYLLTENCQAEAFAGSYKIAVTLNDNLNDGGMVMQTGPYTQVSATAHRWASPLSEQLSTLLTDELLREGIPADRYTYTVRISAFQGNMAGEGTVTAVFTAEPAAGQSVQAHRYAGTVSTALQADGYAALAEALHTSYLQLCRTFMSELAADR